MVVPVGETELVVDAVGGVVNTRGMLLISAGVTWSDTNISSMSTSTEPLLIQLTTNASVPLDVLGVKVDRNWTHSEVCPVLLAKYDELKIALSNEPSIAQFCGLAFTASVSLM